MKVLKCKTLTLGTQAFPCLRVRGIIEMGVDSLFSAESTPISIILRMRKQGRPGFRGYKTLSACVAWQMMIS